MLSTVTRLLFIYAECQASAPQAHFASLQPSWGPPTSRPPTPESRAATLEGAHLLKSLFRQQVQIGDRCLFQQRGFLSISYWRIYWPAG